MLPKRLSNSQSKENANVLYAGEGEEGAEKMLEFFGPMQIDQQIRRAVHFCWMGLPKEKRSLDEVERQIHRLVDRALRDLREDFDEFFGKKGSE